VAAYDANYTSNRGIPTITLGAGQFAAHSTNEFVDIPNFNNGCQLLLSMVTDPMA